MIKPRDSYILNDGARIGVIGGGPTGAFFAIFARKMAKMIDLDLEVTVFEPKQFAKCGPAGCNRCGGVISELLVQTLAMEGITLPDAVVQRGINSYQLHTDRGTVSIATPFLENTIATVYRGGGPLGLVAKDKESFDDFLLRQAVAEGAVHDPARVDRVEWEDDKPCLVLQGNRRYQADLVVGAYGVNTGTGSLFESLGFGYEKPPTVTTAIAEIGLNREELARRFGQSIQLFLLPIPGIKFAAMIPKGTYVTICILGDVTGETVNTFLSHPVVQAVLPPGETQRLSCRCLPKMNVRAPREPVADRVVVCGDAGSTRLFKDGLGAAYLMGKAAATTAIFHGVSREHFQEQYLPIYRSLVRDNQYGQFLFWVTDFYKRSGLLTRAMLTVVEREQRRAGRAKPLSSMLWNMFTGNERYRNIFYGSLSPAMNLAFARALAGALVRRNHDHG
ncbi:hypothetical protein HQ590_03695 [bacterium]|nr:hypothetical protein [bacterium]